MERQERSLSQSGSGWNADRSRSQSQSGSGWNNNDRGWGGNGNGSSSYGAGRNGQRQVGQAGGYDGGRKSSGGGSGLNNYSLNAVKSVLLDTNEYNQDKINHTQIQKDKETEERLKAAAAAATATANKSLGFVGVSEGMSGAGPGVNINYAPMTTATLRLPQGEVTIKMGCVQTTVTETTITLMQLVTVSAEAGVTATEIGAGGAAGPSPPTVPTGGNVLRSLIPEGSKDNADNGYGIMRSQELRKFREAREREIEAAMIEKQKLMEIHQELERDSSPDEVSLESLNVFNKGPMNPKVEAFVPARQKPQEAKIQPQPAKVDAPVPARPKPQEAKIQPQPELQERKTEVPSVASQKVEEAKILSQPKEVKAESPPLLKETKADEPRFTDLIMPSKLEIQTFLDFTKRLPPRYVPTVVLKPAAPENLKTDSQKRAALQLESATIANIKSLDKDKLLDAMKLLEARRDEARDIKKWRDETQMEVNKALKSEEDRIRAMTIRSS